MNSLPPSDSANDLRGLSIDQWMALRQSLHDLVQPLTAISSLAYLGRRKLDAIDDSSLQCVEAARTFLEISEQMDATLTVVDRIRLLVNDMIPCVPSSTRLDGNIDH